VGTSGLSCSILCSSVRRTPLPRPSHAYLLVLFRRCCVFTGGLDISSQCEAREAAKLLLFLLCNAPVAAVCRLCHNSGGVVGLHPEPKLSVALACAYVATMWLARHSSSIKPRHDVCESVDGHRGTPAADVDLGVAAVIPTWDGAVKAGLRKPRKLRRMQESAVFGGAPDVLTASVCAATELEASAVVTGDASPAIQRPLREAHDTVAAGLQRLASLLQRVWLLPSPPECCGFCGTSLASAQCLPEDEELLGCLPFLGPVAPLFACCENAARVLALVKQVRAIQGR
jgi:hypothetical protein